MYQQKVERTFSAPLQYALDMVQAMSERGLTLVPTEPTDEMLAVATAATGASADEARAIYRTMVESS